MRGRNRYAIKSETSSIIIQTSGLQLEKNNLCITYDGRGYKYIIPTSVINDPEQYDAREQVEILPLEESNIKDYKINIRTTITADKLFVIKNNMKISDLVKLYTDYLTSNKVIAERVRLFFGGKELKPENQLYVYEIIDGKIIQAMVMIKEQK